MSNIYKKHVYQYIKKGISVIPDKFQSKMPAIKGWSAYCYKLPSNDEIESWISAFETKGSGIAVCLGEASGLVVLDIDTTDQKVLDIIMPILPKSPVTKVGSKGETRFFRYTGEQTQSLKYNGDMVIEILSSNKKTTMPPSVHPSGAEYKWGNDSSLLNIDLTTLPILPPALFAHLESKLRLEIPEVKAVGGKGLFSGRNNELSSFCGSLIKDKKPIDQCVKELVEFDIKNHTPPLFSDPEEMCHTSSYTNALVFYSNHLNTVNSRRFRESKEYETPLTASSISKVKVEGDILLGKQLGSLKKSKLELPHAPIAKKICPCCNKPRRR